MKQTITETMFKDAFVRMGRQDNFSYDGLSALFDYLTDLEKDTGEEMDLDVIAICCDYHELDIEQARQEYSNILEGVDDEDVQDVLAEYTSVIDIDGDRFIVEVF